MTLTRADEAFCRLMAKALRPGDETPGTSAEAVLDMLKRRAAPKTLDLREAREFEKTRRP